ncbi:hypothetical protein BGX34_011293 [Mortierella sp. NVP85]|nr:hypothetical protein BGX34_011293 [Mortierella sp. NVP85]
MLPEEKGGVPQERKRYLIFQSSDDGLGNRLQALLSSVVLAMVTKRAIVLDWTATPQCSANFTDLFQAPDNLDWDFLTKFPDHKDLKEYKARDEIWYAYCRNCALRSSITPDSTWSDLLCDYKLGLDEKKPIVQVTSTQWFLPVIQHNPYWRQELCHMFPDGGKNAFEILAKKLLRPSQAVQQKIDSVLNRVPDDVTLIGLQVRRTENNAVDSSIEDSFLSCAEEVAEEEEAKFLETWRTGSLRSQTRRDFGRNRRGSRGSQINNDGDSSRLVLEGSMTAAQKSRIGTRNGSDGNARTSRPKFAYYLATDYRPTRAHFQKILGDQLFVLDNTFQVNKSPSSSFALAPSSNVSGSNNPDSHQSNLSETLDNLSPSPSPLTSRAQREAVVRNSVEGVQTAVAEMFLLAQSDRIIMSPYSTFGYFAHAHANVQPNVVKRDGTCIKRKSTQPCFQYWFGFANGGAKCNIRSTVEMNEDYDCWL